MQLPKLREVLISLKKETLINVCRSMNISGYSKFKKPELAAGVAKALLEPDLMQRRLGCLSDGAMALFDKAVTGEYLDTASFTEEDYNYSDDISKTLYCCYNSNNSKFIICEDVKQAYKTNIKDNIQFQDHRKRMSWLLKCYELASYIYGVIPRDILWEMYTSNKAFVPNIVDIDSYLFYVPNDILKVGHYSDDEKLVPKYKGFFIANTCCDCYEGLLEKQGDKPYYVLTFKEIEEFSRFGYLKTSKHLSDLHALLKDKYSLTVPMLYSCMKAIWLGLVLNQEFEDILQLVFDVLKLNSNEHEKHNIAQILAIINNETRMIDNRGHTPNEWHKRHEKHNKPANCFSLPDAVMGYGFDVIDDMDIIPRRISRNAPCPCGSGKKYKRCCGKDAK